VKPCDSDQTTSVQQYEGRYKGDSPFGVVDMAGNVWEWCLTEYETGKVTLENNNMRVLRGGSWRINLELDLRVDFRDGFAPYKGNLSRGFRLSRSF
jgi:formylglycine-generating enzyme required for sulfatase activity